MAHPPAKRPRSGDAKDVSGLVALHRNRLIDWQPSAVVCISGCPDTELVAVGFECGDLELWDLGQMALIQRVAGNGHEITSVCWATDTLDRSHRTFVAHIDGTISEVLWREGRIAHTTDSYGGVVWSLTVQPASAVKPAALTGFPQLLAAACDDGSVRLFGVEGGEPGCILERTLAQVGGRLLTAAWAPSAAAIAVGSAEGNIHLLDAVTGRELFCINAASTSQAKCCVWRVLVLPDGAIVSGDSEGAVQFWDGRLGTRLARFNQHKADVLALAATVDGANVFAAGVDPQVVLFHYEEGSNGEPSSWAYLHYKRPHTHDVRALALVSKDILLSGGLDTQLIAYPAASFLQEHPTRLTKSPQPPQCHITLPPPPTSSTPSQPPVVLLAQHDYVDLWQLGSSTPPACASQAAISAEGDPLDLTQGPRHLARIKLIGARVISCAISPDCQHVACCTTNGIRLYHITLPQAQGSGASTSAPLSASATLQRLKLEPEPQHSVAAVLTNTNLVLAHPDGSLTRIPLPGAGSEASASAPQGDAKQQTVGPSHRHAHLPQYGSQWQFRNYAPLISSLLVSPDERLLLAYSPTGFATYQLPSLQQNSRLNKPDAAVMAAAFSSDSKLLAIALANGQLLLYDTADMKPAAWLLENGEAARACVQRLPGTPAGVSFSPAEGSRQLVVHTAGGLCHLDVNQPLSAPVPVAKRPRGRAKPEERPAVEEGRGSNGRAIKLLDPCLWMGYVGPATLLLLEKPWEEVLAALPAPLLRHRYGS